MSLYSTPRYPAEPKDPEEIIMYTQSLDVLEWASQQAYKMWAPGEAASFISPWPGRGREAVLPSCFKELLEKTRELNTELGV